MNGTCDFSSDTTEEVWAEIPGKPGYVVSNLGQVVSPFGRTLKPQSNGKYGYVGVCLGQGPRHYLHRLVAAAFIGDGEGMDVDHINGDPSDNRLSNLRYLTHAENMAAQRERKPNCRKGHSFTDAYWDPRGRRQCRTCRSEADRRRRRKP